jgi:hypothetical protein
MSVNPVIEPKAKASCAYRITMSSHEWAWTQEEQQQMAYEIIRQDEQLAKLRLYFMEIRDCHSAAEARSVAEIALQRIKTYET